MQGNLDVSGVVRAQSFLQYSDRRLKENIVPIAPPLECIKKMEGKRYCWKDEVSFGRKMKDESSPQEFGLIAQVLKFTLNLAILIE